MYMFGVLVWLSLNFLRCVMCMSQCVYSPYGTEETTAAIGQTAIFVCGQTTGCPSYVWRIYPQNSGGISVSEGATNTVYNVHHETTPSGSNVLRVNSIDENSPTFYQCICRYPTTTAIAFACQQLTVTTFCQVQILVDSRLETFNASNVGPMEMSLFSVTEGEHVAVTCAETSTFKTNCSNIGSSNFTISRSQQNCLFECLYREICTAGVIVNVLHRDDTTTIASTDYSASVTAVTYNSTSSLTYRDTDSKAVTSGACNCIPVEAVLLVSVSILVLVVGALLIYIRYLKTNGFPKPVSTNKAIFLQPVDGPVSTYVNADAGKTATCHTCVPNAEVMVSPMSIRDNHETNCSASKRNVPNCDASGYEIPKNMDCMNEIKYETIN
ncbi:uncharacterized protein [Apostichopus japonicus]|uniref:uncharacterized protein n=1 Tax=Stichopus japonicus TaxID=307972 RepID=UPI003AB53CBE